jgi:hypothetical protein
MPPVMKSRKYWGRPKKSAGKAGDDDVGAVAGVMIRLPSLM